MCKQKLEIFLLLVIGATTYLIVVQGFKLYQLDCIPFCLTTGVIFLILGLLSGAFFPGLSQKAGVWLVVPTVLFFYPLGILSNWFAGGWDIVLPNMMNCDIYSIPSTIIAAVLGSTIGSQMPLIKKNLSRRKIIQNTMMLSLIVISSVLLLVISRNYYNFVKYNMEAPGPQISLEIENLNPVELKGKEYKILSVNGLIWMAENLNYDIGNACLCYDNDPSKCDQFGRLYTWEGAKRACEEIGWRLPTKEEWDFLIKAHGNYKKAYNALKQGGRTGFDAQLGGSFQPPTGKFTNLKRSGGYWSSSFKNEAEIHIWKFGFRREEKITWLDAFPKEWYFSCRCVRDQNSRLETN